MYWLPQIIQINKLYFIIMLYMIFSRHVFSLKFIDNKTFKSNCFKRPFMSSSYSNVRSRIMCAGICARTDSCIGIKFDVYRTCNIYQDGQTCEDISPNEDSCLHFEVEYSSGENTIKCNSTTVSSDIETATSSTPLITTEKTDLPTSIHQMSSVVTSTEMELTDLYTTKSTETSYDSETTAHQTTVLTNEIQTTNQLTTQKESTTTTTTTTTTKILTTQQTLSPCQIDAAAELSDSFMLISGNMVYYYESTAQILIGPKSFTLASSIFPQVTGQINAAYASLSFDSLYILKGQTVYTYSLPGYTYVSQQTATQHFGLTENLSFLDNVIVYTNKVHVFSTNAELVEIDASGGTTTLRFDNNGNSNPYRSNNKDDRPQSITAISHASNSIVLFFESNIVKQLEFGAGSGGKGLWTILGSAMC